jgi:AraC-like DNA-binding protein
MESDSTERYVLLDGSIARLANIRESLAKIDTQVRTARSVFEVLCRLGREHYPALILMSAFEGGVDSVARCVEMSRHDRPMEVPLVAIGPAHSPDFRVQCFRAGAVDFIDNGASAEEIGMRLRKHLQLDAESCPAAAGDNAISAVGSRKHEIHRLAVQYMSSSEAGDMSKQALAQRIGVSAANLDSAFRDVTGYSVVSFLKQQRLEHARTLLRSSSMSVTTIAELLGFSDGANFATAFRQSVGETPSRFRSGNARHAGVVDERVCL